MPPLTCVECWGKLLLTQTKYGLAYLCENFPACKGAHGAHPDGSPMGTPASKDVRVARIRAHGAFDAMWQGADRMYGVKDEQERQFVLKVARTRAYRWLRDRLGLTKDECHLGSFDQAQCLKVEHVCRGMCPELVRAWAKAQKARRHEDGEIEGTVS